jgi:outer membrane protein assembly factor BamB
MKTRLAMTLLSGSLIFAGAPLSGCTLDAAEGDRTPETSVASETQAVAAAAVPRWAKARGDARNSGAGGLGPAGALLGEALPALWQYRATAGSAGNNVNSEPVIDAAGNLYVGGREGVTSLDPGGAVRFRVATGPSTVVYDVQLLADGTALVQASNGTLTKIRQTDGTPLWTVPTGTTGRAASLVVASDGTIFFGDAKTSELVALSPSGAVQFRAKLAGTPAYAPALRPDGLVYVAYGTSGSSTVGLQVVDPRRGRVVWTYRAPSGTPAFVGGVAVAKDGTAYVAGYARGHLLAIDPTRPSPVKWTYAAQDADVTRWSTPVLGPDGTIYLAEGGIMGKGADKRIVALAADGTVRWQTTIRGNVNVSPTLSSDGVLYAASEKELPGASAEIRLNALRASDGALLSETRIPADGVWPGLLASPVVGHGRVYVPVNDGYVSGATLAGSLHAFGAKELAPDTATAEDTSPRVLTDATTRLDTTLYSPSFGFVAWLPRGTKVRLDAPPFDVAPRAGFAWVWAGAREGWVSQSALVVAP